MRIYEIGTGYTSIPAQMGAATEIVVEELTKAFLKQHVDVRIIDIHDAQRAENSLPIEEVWLPQFLNSSSVVKLGLFHKMKRVLYSLALTVRLKSLLKREHAKVVLHFHNQYNLYFFLKLTSEKFRSKCTIAYTVHSYVWMNDWEEIEKTVKKRYFQEVYCCQHADRVFVLNDKTSDNLQNHCGVLPSKLVQIKNGVNTEVYNEKAASLEVVAALKLRYQLSSKKTLLQVGSVCERKNQLGALRLLLPMMKKDESLCFLFAGGVIDAAYYERIMQYAKDNAVAERVIYIGELPPGRILNSWYALSDVCILNSLSESFGMVVVESLSVPRPIFVNTVLFDSVDFLREYEGEGIVRITENFQDDFCRMINDKEYYSEMKEKGRSLVEKEYSWDAVAKKYLENYE